MTARAIPGLTDAQNAAIQSVFAAHPKLDRAVLYGSRALGRHRPNSDIDLVLYGQLDMQLAGKIRAALDELPLPYSFDVIAYDHITHAPLMDHINRMGLEIYRREGAM